MEAGKPGEVVMVPSQRGCRAVRQYDPELLHPRAYRAMPERASPGGVVGHHPPQRATVGRGGKGGKEVPGLRSPVLQFLPRYADPDAERSRLRPARGAEAGEIYRDATTDVSAGHPGSRSTGDERYALRRRPLNQFGEVLLVPWLSDGQKRMAEGTRGITETRQTPRIGKKGAPEPRWRVRGEMRHGSRRTGQGQAVATPAGAQSAQYPDSSRRYPVTVNPCARSRRESNSRSGMLPLMSITFPQATQRA